MSDSEYEAADFSEPETEEVFGELEEMELASELLAVSNEEEMELFIGKLMRRAGRKTGRFGSTTGQALGAILKRAARFALPVSGGKVGTAIVGPVRAADIGGRLATAAGRVFGLELEGLSPEDKEFEVARRFVRFSGDTVREAARMPMSMTAGQVAVAAVTTAADKHAPGLLSPGIVAMPPISGSRKGRWIRRGSTIILLGV